MNNQVICFYHANCTDGAAAAAVIKRKYSEAQLIAMNHGDLIPVAVDGKQVFIVDFSFDAETLKKFKEKAQSVNWYDHHKTALPIFEKIGWGIIDLSESGASLTWKREFPDQPLPKILAYVKDKDLYEWKLPNSRAISMDLRNTEGILDPESPIWQKLIDGLDESEWKMIVERGEYALRSQRIRILSGAKFGFEVDFQGHRGFAVNWSLEASDMGEYIYKDLGYPLAIMFYYTGKIWNFSLRSNQIDVTELALKYGGGGHPGAAGFRQDSIEWLFKMKM